MPRFSANVGFLFQEQPLLDRFAAAARAGFSAVELADPYGQAAAIAERLQAHRLQCVLVNLPMGDKGRGDKGLACLPDRIAEFRDGVVLGADTARALRCPRVNCMAGVAPPDADPALLRATFLDNVRFAARELRKAGVAVSLEALNTVERPGFFLHRAQQAEELVRELAAGGDEVTFQLDLYHMQLMGEDLAALITRMAPLTGHVQFADVPGRHEPGTGTLPFPALFTRLDQAGYRGWVGAEYVPSRRTEETLGWLPVGGP
jgi:hydroxypyruvate isomerase